MQHCIWPARRCVFGASLLLMLAKPRAPGAPEAADLHYRPALGLIFLGLVNAFVFLASQSSQLLIRPGRRRLVTWR